MHKWTKIKCFPATQKVVVHKKDWMTHSKKKLHLTVFLNVLAILWHQYSWINICLHVSPVYLNKWVMTVLWSFIQLPFILQTSKPVLQVSLLCFIDLKSLTFKPLRHYNSFSLNESHKIWSPISTLPRFGGHHVSDARLGVENSEMNQSWMLTSKNLQEKVNIKTECCGDIRKKCLVLTKKKMNNYSCGCHWSWVAIWPVRAWWRKQKYKEVRQLIMV